MKSAQEDFSMPCAEAAERIGISVKTLLKKAADGLIDSRLKGLSKKPPRYFRPSDVERVRRIYDEGMEPPKATC